MAPYQRPSQFDATTQYPGDAGEVIARLPPSPVDGIAICLPDARPIIRALTARVTKNTVRGNQTPKPFVGIHRREGGRADGRSRVSAMDEVTHHLLNMGWK